MERKSRLPLNIRKRFFFESLGIFLFTILLSYIMIVLGDIGKVGLRQIMVNKSVELFSVTLSLLSVTFISWHTKKKRQYPAVSMLLFAIGIILCIKGFDGTFCFAYAGVFTLFTVTLLGIYDKYEDKYYMELVDMYEKELKDKDDKEPSEVRANEQLNKLMERKDGKP